MDTSKSSENEESDNSRVNTLENLIDSFDSFKVKLTNQLINELKEEVING